MSDKYKNLKRKIYKERAKKKMCTDKKQFETEQEAYQKGQRNYKCPHCGKWHRSGQQTKFINQVTNGKPISVNSSL